MPIIYLPAYLTAQSAGETVIACCQMLTNIEDVILINAEQLRFVDPFGLAMLGASVHMLNDQGREVKVENLKPDMAGYMSRMDVFEGVELVGCAPRAVQRHYRGDSLVELRRLETNKRVDEAARDLAYALVGNMPDIDHNEAPDEMTGYTAFDRLVEPIQYALSELLENALTHARLHGYKDSSVWVACQYFPKKGLVRLGVVDNGCGILATLRGHSELRQERHLEAILAALQPRVSCNRDLGLMGESVNQGVGLTTTCRIAEHAGGHLVIVSGGAIHDTSGTSSTLPNVGWQGVAISLECIRDRLADIRFKELLPPLGDIPKPRLRFE